MLHKVPPVFFRTLWVTAFKLGRVHTCIWRHFQLHSPELKRGRLGGGNLGVEVLVFAKMVRKKRGRTLAILSHVCSSTFVWHHWAERRWGQASSWAGLPRIYSTSLVWHAWALSSSPMGDSIGLLWLFSFSFHCYSVFFPWLTHSTILARRIP